MGIKNNNNHHYNHQISSFNPALCLRPPFHPPQSQPMLIKDIINTLPSSNIKTVVVPTDDDHNIMVFSPSPPSKHRTHKNKTRDREVQLFLSPRIGCMGQIKRSSSCSNSNGNKHNTKKIFQFQRMFSNMSLKSSRGSARVEDDCFNKSSRRRRDDDISIADTMDLPLPVVKRMQQRDAEVSSLWRRRRGGDGLRLQGMEDLRDSFWRSEHHCRLAA